jgi:GAF domain-containing protein
MIASEGLAALFVELADTLVVDFDNVEFLHMVTARTADITRADAAGLVLADEHNHLQFMAASTESARMLELFQLQAPEGPCRDCYRFGIPVINSDLFRAAGRWPRFAPEAVTAGYRAVHAFPLRHRGNVIGALNLFSTAVGRIEADDIKIIQALADAATIGLLQQRALTHTEILAEQLQGALNSRVTIEQAKGALARMRGVSVDEAFKLMRDHSGRHHRRLTDLALAVVTDSASHPDPVTPLRHRAHVMPRSAVCGVPPVLLRRCLRSAPRGPLRPLSSGWRARARGGALAPGTGCVDRPSP